MKNKIFIFFLLCFPACAFTQNNSLNADQSLAHDIFKELIEINTTHSTGNTTIAAEAVKKRLVTGGYAEKDIQVIGPEELNRNLVLRVHGSGKGRPVLFLAHLDVVEAKKEDWTFDPFILTEKDGYFYGRGTVDIKNGAAILVEDFIRLKREGYKPEQDLILALTAGEEAGGNLYNGVQWLLDNHRPLIDAEYCINMDAGSPRLVNGKRVARFVQTSEKGFMDLQLEVKNPGGHSSLPSKNNAIYHLAKALTNVADYDFPAEFNATAKSYFTSIQALESAQIAADLKVLSINFRDTAAINRLSAIPLYNALMRTTCVATMVEGGHAVGALPQTATANLNCRLMPGSKQEVVADQIRKVVADSQVVVTVTDSLKNNPPSELSPALKKIIEQVTEKLWPGVPLIPVMSTGATDGLFLRNAGIPTFGVSGVGSELGENRAHGKDERVLASEFYDGLEYEYVLIKAVSSSR